MTTTGHNVRPAVNAPMIFTRAIAPKAPMTIPRILIVPDSNPSFSASKPFLPPKTSLSTDANRDAIYGSAITHRTAIVNIIKEPKAPNTKNAKGIEPISLANPKRPPNTAIEPRSPLYFAFLAGFDFSRALSN